MHIHKTLLAGSCPLLAAGLATLGFTGVADARRAPGDPVPDVTPVETPVSTAPKLFELEKATIKDIQSAMSEGSLTSVELVHLYLRRIQAYNQSSPIAPVQPLNAILFLNPDLFEDAAQADRLRKQGIILGPLHGIPCLVKGSFPVAGLPVSGGTTALQDMVTQHDCWSVAKLRQAGAIIMGQANMDTWANSATTSSSQVRGAVRSAYLQAALPGGSSGGSGVSAGAYLTNFTFGGETGGSIRNPGDRNGLVAYKVSGGSISVNTIIPLSPERDVIGPMTRAAVDNAIVRDVVGAKDPDDGWAPILPILEDKRPVPQTGFVTAVQAGTLRGKKIGIIGTYVGMTHPVAPMTTIGNVAVSGTTGVGTDISVASTDGAMIGMLVSGSGISTTTTITAIDRVAKVIRVSGVITAPRVDATYTIAGTANTRGVQTTLANTLALVQQAKADMEAAGATVPYVFLPPEADTTVVPDGTPAALAGTDSSRLSAWVYRGFLEAAVSRPDFTYSQNAAEVLRRATTVRSYISDTIRGYMYTQDANTGVYSPGPTFTYGDQPAVNHYTRRNASKNGFEAWMDANNLDAVVWPVWPNKTRTNGTIIGRDLVNAMYLPGVTVPMGRLTQPAATVSSVAVAEGQEPLTMNFTGRLYDDDKVLGLAYAYEQATKHRYSPPLAPPVAGEVFDFKRQSKKPYSTDKKPPVVTVGTTASSTGSGGAITFSGSAADAGGVDRLEVSVAGTVIPATVSGSTWTAVLPASSSSSLFLGSATTVELQVLAVDLAGNATGATGSVSIQTLVP